MKETRSIEFFKETQEKLAQKQNEKRDAVLDSLLSEKFGEAKTLLEELQTVSVGIQVCQQTILRAADMEAREQASKETLRALPPPPPLVAKKKGWFGR